MSDDRRGELNFSLLVERMVPLMAELFATLATRDPLRMHFADIAGKTLLDIVETLRDQGVGQEAIAASLDMSISGFRSKLKRLRELYQAGEGDASADQRQRTLLERIYAFIGDAVEDNRDAVTYAGLRDHFKGTKDDTLKGVLSFLVQYGLVSVTGRGAHKEYRLVSRRGAARAGYVDAVVTLYREGPLSMEELATRLELPEDVCAEHVEAIRAEGCLEEVIDKKGVHRYRATDYHIPMDAAAGYEAALWDHMRAVVDTLCKKVRLGTHEAHLHDVIGGTTFSFEVPKDHPLYADISGYLQDTRQRMEDWLDQARALEGTDADNWQRVTIYTGQRVDDLSGDRGD